MLIPVLIEVRFGEKNVCNSVWDLMYSCNFIDYKLTNYNALPTASVTKTLWRKR